MTTQTLKSRWPIGPSAHRPIDLDPDHNGLKTSWPVAATMPIEVMEEFAREGWIGRDSMHFQPTR